MMKFRDLLYLPCDERSGVIELQSILDALPDTPREVAEQVYRDHGRKEAHQIEYGELDIGSIRWERKEVTAADIQSCVILPRFAPWVHRVSERLDSFKNKGWGCIDVRPNVWQHWEKQKTWLVEPVCIQHRFVDKKIGMHLFEGHTRVGVLRGLLSRSLISPSSIHGVWYGA